MIRAVRYGVIAAALYGAWGIAMSSFPVSPWLDYRSVTALDADYGQPVMIIADRDINMPAQIFYDVIVREVGNSRPVCFLDDGGGYTYQPSWDDEGRPLPIGPVTLEYWSDGKCLGAHLKPGFYTVTTEWSVERPWPLDDGRVIVTSNIFEVRPK